MFRKPILQRGGTYRYFNRVDVSRPRKLDDLSTIEGASIATDYSKEQTDESFKKDVPVDELSQMISQMKVGRKKNIPKGVRKSGFV